MKRLALIIIVIALLVAGCRQESIINGTPVSGSPLTPSVDTSDDAPADSGDLETDDNNGVQIDQVIVNISDSEGGDNEPDITDVISDDTEDSEKDMSGYFGKLSVNFIDVGYGDAVFVMTPMNGTLMIDGGDDACGSIITKYLRQYGIFYYLDVMIATNPTRPHIGGLDSILFNMIQVAEIYDNGEKEETQSYNQFYEMANNKGMFIVPAKDTQVKIGKEEDVKLDLIIPYKDGYSDKKEDNSIVVKMKYGDVSFLFMSDCTSACEDKLKGYDLKADILKIGDFGSNESTSDEFLDNVKPKVAIISTDMTECSFSLLDTVKKLEDRGIRVYRTDIYGTITVESDGKTFSLKTEKSPGEEGEGQQE